MSTDDLLRALLAAPPHPGSHDSPEQAWRDACACGQSPVERAALGGLHADRVAWAFVCGYQAAGRALVPGTPDEPLAALCVTEPTGNRPRDVRTTLRPAPAGGFVLDGTKSFVSLGDRAGLLFVAASIGADEAGRNRLRLARLTLPSAGISLVAGAELPFVPEVGHAEVRLASAPVAEDEVLPGDGWDRYVKPFRTIEDLHVQLAIGAHLLRLARLGGFPRASREDLLAVLCALCALGPADPSSPATHVALAGAQRALAAWIDRAAPDLAGLDGETRARWERDRALLGVAGKARALRLEAAWAALGEN